MTPSKLDTMSVLTPGKPPFVLLASIGNPEDGYGSTRHNVGHQFLNELVQHHWTDFEPFKVHRNLPHGEVSLSNEMHPNLVLFKSTNSLMNLQGGPISQTWEKIRRLKESSTSPALVVVHDELQLPLGKFQIRRQGTSARGHNGLRSISNSMGSGYTKIGIGIGKPAHRNVALYVLGSFKQEEKMELSYNVFPKIIEALAQMEKGEHIYEVYK
ncbi:aminoacyl-tRNA hydrolase [Scheffersomyces spartinae]|uniref:Peptidyl-tRNA hydrolase n=1 Tax=Scheffersomyces spartinae TaxID=45513 RepID=A0A9P7V9X3_9ASCO|nr:aminoacyl-tRNA hydrolase [Scheffersomyces spartinae]KAG7193730.1 aminoacyl-tRNA hydrolase [Scheffersomyces spartinae]